MPTKTEMANRLPSFLPRVAALVLVALGATAGLTYAAGSELPSSPAVPTVSTTPAAPVIVPDVRNQAFVFAKSTLEESGFAWQVDGSVHGYPANIVVSQSPAPGTRLVDVGAPRIKLTLKQGPYHETGDPADTSPYNATAPQPADLAGRPIGPAAPAESSSQTVLPTPKAATHARATAKAPPAVKAPTSTTAAAPAAAAPATPVKSATAYPQNRPVAFVVPGARKEPLDEMPLPTRAKALQSWLEAHPHMSSASSKYWLYQNEWIVTGAKLGWWRGAEALKTLIAVDRRAQSLWGIGAKSAGVAERALSDVQTRAKS